MGFKKAFKKARKALGLPAVTLGNAAKVGAAIATGGVGAGAAALGAAALKSKLKSAAVGGAKQMVHSKAAKALAHKVVKLAPRVAASAKAATMPGGAPLAKAAKRAAKRVARAATKKATKRARKAAAKATGKKRQAPKGGKDFKALSASWKAAGKPGTWLAWVKSH